ncbi:MAG: YceI family protein [Bacteroidia bacterium]
MTSLKIVLAMAAFGSILLMSFSPVLESKTYKVDTQNSLLNWVGKKVTGKHTGEIKLQSGEFQFNNGKLSGGHFVVDMTSITVTDLQGEWRDKLLGHLKSDDFFGVENFKTATFKTTSIKPGAEANSYTVTGKLTIKGITEPVTFPVTVSEEGGKMKTAGTAIVDRTKYGIRYGSGSFFDNLGDKTISDNFELIFEIVSE